MSDTPGSVPADAASRRSTLIRDCAGIAGGLLISVGAAMAYLPAGPVVAGALLLAGALVTARQSS